MPAFLPPLTIFILEDNDWYRELLAYRLNQNPDYTIRSFGSAKACLDHLTQTQERPDLITLDYSLPDGQGDDVFKRLRVPLPDVPILVVSAQEDVSTAVGLLRQGAYDYLVKDEDTADRLWHSVHNVRQQVALRLEVEQLRQQIGQKNAPAQPILGESAPMQALSALIDKAARTAITVSLSGETGTGKELVARAIHFRSERRNQPFVAVNVAAIPRELIESELFGHEKGAFTGAVSRRIGRFEEAHGGTLFLDEIAELDLNLQAKLLRVLQEREVTRVGSNKTIAFDARLMVATHHDLAERVKENLFREDLYYRLLGLPIKLPPLRERGEDVLLLADNFLRKSCLENNLPMRQFSADARKKLLQYAFPGNVRELKAVVELAAVLADGDVVRPQDLSLRNGLGNASESGGSQTLREQIAAIVQRYLDAHKGNILLVAQQLQIGKSTIYRMIQNHEVRVR
ncbi:sigma-54-dependent Fis family transcriptional regulator [Hymenobacter busanensis]|uniref:Sigma-54-dependent Fis family transcriptional regulator n=1 Tax=Hymenobacter busanensis TaxID=2607656 RepID=A0A7L4ZWZ6_9BACT|nr:sigma-54 dependent transcriptional regulator [Hymenobacter busanensis]KAA9333294.1 sigma-54-dependent Fis family transcriptional regulator [Hymenobacter busanensis]QHJ08029.1 response regulator [Hymenobacter busanensis]